METNLHLFLIVLFKTVTSFERKLIIMLATLSTTVTMVEAVLLGGLVSKNISLNPSDVSPTLITTLSMLSITKAMIMSTNTTIPKPIIKLPKN